MVPSQPWSERELVDLGQLSSVGIPIEHIAKFLGRNLDEVETQARSISADFAQSSGNRPLVTAPKKIRQSRDMDSNAPRFIVRQNLAWVARSR